MVVRVAVFGATGGASPSPTKSERDSAVLEGLVRGEGWWCGNPSGSRQNFFGRQHLTFDKGGKFGGAGQGDGCTFEKVVGMERLVGDPSVLRQIGLSEY